MSEAPVIQLEGVEKVFDEGLVRALDGADLAIREGEWVSIVGPSGCGKSTLLHLVAALDRPTAGRVIVGGEPLEDLDDLNRYRARQIGLVFQLDNLLPTLTASENVQVPMMGQGLSRRERQTRATELLELVGLEQRANYRPARLSGGERQRVAIARALANTPRILLADEPTGRLDSASGRRIMELLRRLKDERGLTVVVVTHDPGVAQEADRIVQMLDGKVVGEKPGRGAPTAIPSA